MKLCATGLLLGLGMLLTAPAAWADAPPFTDPGAHGFLALCDRSGHQVTSGNVDAAPFVWNAISSAAAPAAYVGANGKAVLVAYQPRQQVDPGQWSGGQLTGSSFYTNPMHPVAQSTETDQPLLSFVQSFPPKWDGLVQLRMYFSAPGLPPVTRSYPATTLRITGNRWQVVDGGTLSCQSGKGTSIESVYLRSPSPAAVAGSTSSPAPAAGSAQPTGGRSGSAAAPPTTPADHLAATSFLGSPGSYAGLAALVALLAGLGWSTRRHLRSSRTGAHTA